MLLAGSAVVGTQGAVASAATCSGWGAQPPNVGTAGNYLQGVAATWACNSWTVGYYYDTGLGRAQNLIEHWNGTTWAVQTSPDKGTQGNLLTGVTATSSSNAWAVGYYGDGSTTHGLILR